MSALPPGSTIGILGGGQLGRMLAISAAQLGYKCHIYCPDADSIAAEVSAIHTQAAYEDIDALRIFAKSCDILTYEFENIPVAPLDALGHVTAIQPRLPALLTAQDRLKEKQFVREHGGRTARFSYAKTDLELENALEETGFPARIKTIRMGYDGKGQVRVTGKSDLASAWRRMGAKPAIIEAEVKFDAEFSVIAVRSTEGEMRFWDSPKNVHIDGILSRSSLPAGPFIESQQAEARKLVADVADALEYVGVLTFEFFATPEGPIFNEMAPRVHNSGHWTIEGAETSQFENHIRAICNLPLGNTETIADRMEMDNLIGDRLPSSEKLLADPTANLHWYGKREAQPGRKMGHVTRLYR